MKDYLSANCVAIVAHGLFLKIRDTLVVLPMDEMSTGKLLPLDRILMTLT